MDLAHRQRHEHDPHDDRQRDDRPGPRQPDVVVEAVEDPLHHVLERRAGSRQSASRVVDPAVRPRVAAQQPPAGQRRRRCSDAVLADRERPRTREQLGWYLQVFAGRSGEIERAGRAGSARIATRLRITRPPSRAPRRRAPRASRGRSPRPPRAGPGARRARSRSSPGRARAAPRHDLAQLPLDPVADDRVPDRLRHREAEPRLAERLVALEPVERQEARRDRPALPVDGVEVAGAGEAVPALHRLTPRGACGPWRGGA